MNSFFLISKISLGSQSTDIDKTEVELISFHGKKNLDVHEKLSASIKKRAENNVRSLRQI